MRRTHIIKIFILILIISIINECTNEGIQDFNKFIKEFEKAIKNRDKKLLDKLMYENFQYTFRDERDDYSRNEVLENFDFKLVEKILKGGYTEKFKGSSGFSPSKKNLNKYQYALSFVNIKNKGWQITTIYFLKKNK